MLEKIKENPRISIYIFLILGIFVFTFAYGLQKGMHRTFPEALGQNLKCLGVAISDLRYGLKGYSGYNKIITVLEEGGITKPVVNNSVLINSAIKKVLNIEGVSSMGRYYIPNFDKGLPAYDKLAFVVFGYRIESLFYLYFLLLLISIMIFLLTFYSRIELLNILLLFVCSHFIVVAAAPVIGIELQSVYNVRFLPVLAILPALYLALIILGKHRFTKSLLTGVFFQASILIFAFYIRSGTIYQLVFLFSVFTLALLWRWITTPHIGRYAFNKVNFYPIGVVLLLFFILKLCLNLTLNYPYTSAGQAHSLWHPAYIGLSAHPDAMKKYGIELEDYVSQKLVTKRLISNYGMDVSSSRELYDSILKDEFSGILRRDPWFVITSYLYKLSIFIKNYFNFYLKSIPFPFKIMLIGIVFMGGLLARHWFQKKWLAYFCLLILGLFFSFVPSFILVPINCYIAEPALLFTMIIFIGITAAIYSVTKRIPSLLTLRIQKGESRYHEKK